MLVDNNEQDNQSDPEKQFTGLENYNKFHCVLNTLGPAAYNLNYAYHNVENVSVLNQF